LWLLLWVLVLFAWWFPIKFASLRLLLVLGVLGLWLGALLLFWRVKLVRAIVLIAMLFTVALLASPGREYSRRDLRSRYVAALQTYDATPYVWGGESRRGIDCSGLVRRGLIDANLRTGIATLNPTLVRTALSLWWHDASAKAMMEEYRGATRKLFSVSSLNALDDSQLMAGDFAVTSNGVHTLAYIGNKTWIEADPGPMRVIKVRVPSRNAWFSMPMQIMRWRELDSP
jgi:hypothetical protein